MPETLLDSGSEFDRYKARLGRWLRDHFRKRTSLRQEDIAQYAQEKSLIAGWEIETEHSGRVLKFHILIDDKFPYSRIYAAYKSEEVYLRWPHVELAGLLCLPGLPAPIANLEEAITFTIEDAVALVDKCADPKFVEEELRKEFLSYWNRSANSRSKPVRSLLDPGNHATRVIAVWYGDSYVIVGESPDQIESWLKNRGKKDSIKTVPGVFGHLDTAPIFPFPENVRALSNLLGSSKADVQSVLESMPLDQDLTLVLAADSPSGEGLMAIWLGRPSLNGFRPSGGILNSQARQLLWGRRNPMRRGKVERFDSNWVHGRGLNQSHATLFDATVLVIGCGSLGSQVANRLAQAGVGGLILVDPDLLSTANVGRHLLGIDSVDHFKATAIATQLRARFPHMRRIESYSVSWQGLYKTKPDIFESATLTVACLGEWSADGQLNELTVRTQSSSPIIYGWLDENGSASHAVGLSMPGPSLSCILDEAGHMRVPESEWKVGGLVQAEPACGTLFQPYGPIDVAHAEALVSRLCLDVISGAVTLPAHRVYATSTAELVQAGGVWTPEHYKYRPLGFEGPFQYDRTVSACGVCKACKEAK